MPPNTSKNKPAKKTSNEPLLPLLVEVVREKLATLGDYSHLQIRHDGSHILVEHPGPPDDPDDALPVLRLTPLGGLPMQFGLSFASHEGRWEKLPIHGLLQDVLSEAVDTLAPYLEADEPSGG